MKIKLITLEERFRPSRELKFDFKQKCIFCCEVINEEFLRKQRNKPVQKREQVFDVRTLKMKENISKTAN